MNIINRMLVFDSWAELADLHAALSMWVADADGRISAGLAGWSATPTLARVTRRLSAMGASNGALHFYFLSVAEMCAIHVELAEDLHEMRRPEYEDCSLLASFEHILCTHLAWSDYGYVPLWVTRDYTSA